MKCSGQRSQAGTGASRLQVVSQCLHIHGCTGKDWRQIPSLTSDARTQGQKVDTACSQQPALRAELILSKDRGG